MSADITRPVTQDQLHVADVSTEAISLYWKSMAACDGFMANFILGLFTEDLTISTFTNNQPPTFGLRPRLHYAMKMHFTHQHTQNKSIPVSKNTINTLIINFLTAWHTLNLTPRVLISMTTNKEMKTSTNARI